MSSIKTGDRLEAQIYLLLKRLISEDQFWAKKECCSIHQKKAYFSKDRNSQIVFDIAIEVSRPGAKEYSLLILVECKNYGHPVPVDDVEEFFAKIQQVAGANVKGIVASTSAFQKSAFNYARSKGIGFLRHFDQQNFKWELNRNALVSVGEQNRLWEAGLLDQNHQSQCFEVYCLTPRTITGSFGELVHDLAGNHAAGIFAKKTRRSSNQVPFLSKEKIESVAERVLSRINYKGGEASLETICRSEADRKGLKVIQANVENEVGVGTKSLGQITFEPLEIHIFKQTSPHVARERFTLAHELSHHFLGHGRYMRREYCQVIDLQLENRPKIEVEDIRRMEWQANFLASCILLPKSSLLKDFQMELSRRNIRDKGFGALFVDAQRVNVESFRLVTSALMLKYRVSRSVLKYRLQGFSLLVDSREPPKGGGDWDTLLAGMPRFEE